MLGGVPSWTNFTSSWSVLFSSNNEWQSPKLTCVHIMRARDNFLEQARHTYMMKLSLQTSCCRWERRLSLKNKTQVGGQTWDLISGELGIQPHNPNHMPIIDSSKNCLFRWQQKPRDYQQKLAHQNNMLLIVQKNVMRPLFCEKTTTDKCDKLEPMNCNLFTWMAHWHMWKDDEALARARICVYISMAYIDRLFQEYLPTWTLLFL